MTNPYPPTMRYTIPEILLATRTELEERESMLINANYPGDAAELESVRQHLRITNLKLSHIADQYAASIEERR